MLQKSSLFSPADIDLSTWGNWHAQLHLLEVKSFLSLPVITTKSDHY